MPHAARTALTRSAPLAFAALLVLTGCGSDDGGGEAATVTTTATTPAEESPAEESPAEEPTSEAPAEAETLSVSSVDFDFELPSTDLTAGEYTIELVNDGGATHDLVVERDGEDVGETEQIGPGETSTATVTLEPGEYVFYCSVGNHRDMGMEVTVTVT